MRTHVSAEPADYDQAVRPSGGAYPDDPESGCGGTIAFLSDVGHEVVIVFLTRGEAGASGTPPEDAARIRTAECHKACDILKARPEFAGQVDEQTEVNNGRYKEFAELLDSQQPDLGITHWLVDTHRGHRAASLHGTANTGSGLSTNARPQWS